MTCKRCESARKIAIESFDIADLLLTILRREGGAVAEQKLLKKKLDSCFERFCELKTDADDI